MKIILLNQTYKRHRLLLIAYAVIMIFIVFVVRIIKVGLELDLPKNSFIRSSSLRRDIVDRNGKLLATSVEVASVFAKPNRIQNKEYAAQEVSSILSLDIETLRQQFNGDKKFIWLKRSIDPNIARQVFDLGIEGIDIEYEYKRLYPYGNLVSHVIGYTGIDNDGLAGVEREFNLFLTNYDISLQSSLKSKTATSNVFELISNIDSNNPYSEQSAQSEVAENYNQEFSQKLDQYFNITGDEDEDLNEYNELSRDNKQGISRDVSENLDKIPSPLEIQETKELKINNSSTSSSIIGVDLSSKLKTIFNFISNKKLDNKPDSIHVESFFEPLQLSIDIDMQYIVSEELDEAMKEFGTIKATCIIVDPATGDILTAVNKPDFNPHKIQDKNALFPSGWYGLYEVGSVFKSLIFATAIDSKSATLNSVFNIKKFNIGKYTIKDYHYHEKKQNLAEIFMHSSNIGLSLLAMSINQDTLRNYLKDFGLFDELKIELPERIKPKYIKAKKWEPITVSTVSYGYGISITPMHFIQAMVPVVNGGDFFDLTILKDRNINDSTRAPKKILNKNTSNDMNKLLRMVVTDGNAHRADVPGLLIGGKTGTAEKIKNKKYDKNTRVSSFISIFPANKPKYLIYLLLDEPKGNKSTYGFATAGFTAVPVTAKIISRIALIKPLN